MEEAVGMIEGEEETKAVDVAAVVVVDAEGVVAAEVAVVPWLELTSPMLPVFLQTVSGAL